MTLPMMRRNAVLRLVAGFRRFRRKYFEPENSPYRRLLSFTQSPKTLVIGCSDSRVDPAIISSAGPGELFVVRNVANLVPPFEVGGSRHGTSAALEFAVNSLKVENIIVLGHRQCGGIRALVTDSHHDEQSFISRWMSVAQPALERTRRDLPNGDVDALCHRCELESIKTSVENLMTFPFVRAAVEGRGLNVIGAYFDLEIGELRELDNDSGEFHTLKV